jgi:hypothetical protein
LKGTGELQVAWPKVEDLLHAGTSVEEGEKERVIAATVGSRPIGSIEEGPDLVGFEILDDA